MNIVSLKEVGDTSSNVVDKNHAHIKNKIKYEIQYGISNYTSLNYNTIYKL